jgi:hypothetical protein
VDSYSGLLPELAEVYRDDKETLGDFFAYMVVLLERSGTMTPLEKKKTKEVLNMYNSLWDQSPIIQQMRAASKAEGKVEGKVETLQEMVVSTVQLRFPALTELARQKASQVDKPELLKKLHDQIILAPDEASVHLLLVPTVA